MQGVKTPCFQIISMVFIEFSLVKKDLENKKIIKKVIKKKIII